MKFRIVETQEEKELEIRWVDRKDYDRDMVGLDYICELLGNNDALNYNKETEEYELKQDDYKWWLGYINNHEQDVQEVFKLADELDIDENEIWDRINDELGSDMDREHQIIQDVLDEIRDERSKK